MRKVIDYNQIWTELDVPHLITKIKKNMKNSLMLLQDKIALRQRVFNRNSK